MNARPAPLLLVLTAAALLAWGTGAAVAAKPGHRGHPSVRILAPKPGAQIGKRVVVRVRAQGSHFRAMLDGRDVSGRFHRDGAVRTARLRLGRDYRPGDVSLLVAVGRRRARTDLRYFYALRRRDGSAKLRLGWDRRRHASPLLTLRARRPIRSVHVWLNGRRVERDFRTAGRGHRISARLAPHSGLRYGRNHVVFRVVERGGILARVGRDFRVRRGRPLADSGRDRRVGVSHPVILDGSATLPEAHGRAGLRYHWRILQAPPGSKAKVPAAGAPRSRFVPDVPGTYKVRLAVSDAAGDRSVDESVVEAPETIAPMGLPIQTRTEDGGIQIGGKSWGPNGSWVQMLVLNDRNALEEEGAWGGPSRKADRGFSIGESAALLQAVEATGPNQLVILSGQCCSSGPNAEAAKNLTAAIEYLGGTVQTWGPTPHGAEDLWQGVENHWSVIGHYGLARAAANQNITYAEAGIPGFLNGEPGQPGSLNGYLQEVTTLGYEFVSPENVSLDTKWTPTVSTPPSETQNTIAVGTQHYQSATVAPGTIAIQLLLLDPSSLQLVSNETFEVIKPNQETAFAGIHALDQKLHEINTEHAIGYSPLIVLQDFGRHEASNWPGGNSTDWLEDTLPGTGDSREWSGNPFPNTTADLLHSWNQANPLGTVAGNLGELVGPSFHDVVANYRRPYYDSTADKVVPRVTGGLTMVTEPHLYQWSSAFGQGQSNPALSSDGTIGNGRVTGTLTRNEQAQWQLSSPANGPGFEVGSAAGEGANLLDPEALWDLVFQPTVPWPCSFQQPAPCPQSPRQIAEADRYIAGRLFGKNVPEVRGMYAQEEEWPTKAAKLKEIPYPVGQGFSRQVFVDLSHQLAVEFQHLGEVKTGIKSWESVIGSSGGTAHFNVEAAATKVIGEVQKAEGELLAHEAELNTASSTADGLLVASSVIEYALAGGALPEELAFGPPMLGGLSAIIALGDDLFGEGSSSKTRPSESQQSVPDDTEAIRDKVANLGLDLQARYVAVNETMGHFQDVFATDWGKLSKAAENFSTVWSLNSQEEKLIAQSFSVSADRQLYNATIPMAFSQWIISPQKTDINGLAALELPEKNYQCRHASNYYNTYKVNEWEPVGGETSVLWTGGDPGPNKVPYTVRFLKPWKNNIQTSTTNDLYGEGKDDTLVPDTGGNPSETLMNPLFEPISVSESSMFPTNLGMNKDEFFGQPWGMQQLQCGIPQEPNEG